MTAAKVARSGPARPRPSATGSAQSLRELVMRLDHLRASVREVTRAYLANLEHDIIEVRDAVTGGKPGAGRKQKLRRTVVERMTEMVDDLRLKPQKGRRSDLKKVEKIVRSFQRLVTKHTMPESRNRG
jgi:hypothetical protein